MPRRGKKRYRYRQRSVGYRSDSDHGRRAHAAGNYGRPVQYLAGGLGSLLAWLVGLVFGRWRRRSAEPAAPTKREWGRARLARGASVSPLPRSGSGLVPPAVPVALPYRRREHLVSKGERAFWYPLYLAVKGKYRIFCKVRLQDVVCAPPDVPGERYWFRKIRGYHVDFVLCEPTTTCPLLAIELDDRSHRSPDRIERDRFKDAVLTAGGVPMYRVPARQAYDPVELAAEIARLIAPLDAGMRPDA